MPDGTIDIPEKKTATNTSLSSPLVIAIFTAALAAFGNIILAYVNNSAQQSLERAKEEGNLILEMIKTTPAKARINLQFLVEAGLISDKAQVEKLNKYFATHRPQTGPSLPVSAPSAEAAKKSITSCAEIPSRLKRMFSEHLGVPITKVTDAAKIQGDLNADELDLVELTMAAEEEFNVAVPDDVSAKLKTVEDYIKFVQNARIDLCKKP